MCVPCLLPVQGQRAGDGFFLCLCLASRFLMSGFFIFYIIVIFLHSSFPSSSFCSCSCSCSSFSTNTITYDNNNNNNENNNDNNND